MASVFQLGADKGKRDAPWWIEYIDEFGKRRRKKGYSRKRETDELAADIEREVRQKKLGLIDPHQQALRNHRSTQIEAHLADYENYLDGGSRTVKHKTLTMSRIRDIVAGTGIQSLDDLQSEKIDAYLRKLRKIRKKPPALRTLNHYVQAVQGWCRWLVKNGRLSVSPVEGLTTYNAKTDIRHKRRALTIDEVTKLVASARSSSEVVQGTGPELRARLYTLAFLTGLRRQELASLTPSSFDLKSTPPQLTVAAAFSKHRKEDELALHPELIRSIPSWLRGLNQKAPLFPKLAHRKTWLMVKKDLERVGIPYKTSAGYADFHSLRHTYVSMLLGNGVSLTQTQKLARHDDVRMTIGYNNHTDLIAQADALKSLPWTPPSESFSQQIVSTSAQPTSDDVSRHGTACRRTEEEVDFESPENSSVFVTSWHNETGDGDDSHHPLLCGGGGNRTRVP
ncbi:tyrosine-type recombinase/integrase [Aeoliella sp. SH292]|uniref:tyrosine-type recombinase/integrase n=1 Tax=Aeoliella sp. SH292 TaxID=3454464 RepID=UPI003F9B7BE0